LRDSKGCQRTMNVIGVGGLIVLGAVLIGSIPVQKYGPSNRVAEDIKKNGEQMLTKDLRKMIIRKNRREL